MPGHKNLSLTGIVKQNTINVTDGKFNQTDCATGFWEGFV
jgi:hypothetical protein